MKKPTISVRRSLQLLGNSLKKARLRRRLPMKIIAERAMISRETLAKIQSGDPGVGMGNYAMVIFALGFGTDWMQLADLVHDHVGQALDEERLPRRARASRCSSKKTKENKNV